MSKVRARLAAALTDRYRIERELAAGRMATVYLAEDLDLSVVFNWRAELEKVGQ